MARGACRSGSCQCPCSPECQEVAILPGQSKDLIAIVKNLEDKDCNPLNPLRYRSHREAHLGKFRQLTSVSDSQRMNLV